jgi:hypothetical protein
MLPGRFSLQLYRGDSASYQFTIWSDRQGMTPLDIAGCIPLAEIRDAPGGLLLATMTTIIQAPNIVKMSLTPGQTLALPHKAVWDLQLSFGTSEVLTPIAGGVAVQDDVSASLPPPPPGEGPVVLPDPIPIINPQDWPPGPISLPELPPPPPEPSPRR